MSFFYLNFRFLRELTVLHQLFFIYLVFHFRFNRSKEKINKIIASFISKILFFLLKLIDLNKRLNGNEREMKRHMKKVRWRVHSLLVPPSFEFIWDDYVEPVQLEPAVFSVDNLTNTAKKWAFCFKMTELLSN